MRVLLLTDGIYPYVIGGMQKHSYYLAKYLTNTGNKVTLVHCMVGKGSLPAQHEVQKSLGVHDVVTLRFPTLDSLPGHYLRESYHYSKMVFTEVEQRLNEFDFIYAKGFSAWHLLKVKQRGIKCPPVGVNFHGYEMFQPAPGPMEWLKMCMLKAPVRWNSRTADVVFSYGGGITDIIRSLGVPMHRIAETPTGIEETWLRSNPKPQSGNERDFLFIGRYERRKGIEELNKVLQTLPSSLNFRFHFIGPIPSSKQVRSERVVYHGKVMDKDSLTALIDACQILVVPSHSEGMPNVIMEGMARGLAVIATNVGAVRLMVDSNNGILIRSKDINGLRKAIEDMAKRSDKELLRMREASVERVRKEFLWEKVIERKIRHLESIVNKSKDV